MGRSIVLRPCSPSGQETMVNAPETTTQHPPDASVLTRREAVLSQAREVTARRTPATVRPTSSSSSSSSSQHPYEASLRLANQETRTAIVRARTALASLAPTRELARELGESAPSTTVIDWTSSDEDEGENSEDEEALAARLRRSRRALENWSAVSPAQLDSVSTTAARTGSVEEVASRTERIRNVRERLATARQVAAQFEATVGAGRERAIAEYRAEMEDSQRQLMAHRERRRAGLSRVPVIDLQATIAEETPSAEASTEVLRERVMRNHQQFMASLVARGIVPAVPLPPTETTQRTLPDFVTDSTADSEASRLFANTRQVAEQLERIARRLRREALSAAASGINATLEDAAATLREIDAILPPPRRPGAPLPSHSRPLQRTPTYPRGAGATPQTADASAQTGRIVRSPPSLESQAALRGVPELIERMLESRPTGVAVRRPNEVSSDFVRRPESRADVRHRARGYHREDANGDPIDSDNEYAFAPHAGASALARLWRQNERLRLHKADEEAEEALLVPRRRRSSLVGR